MFKDYIVLITGAASGIGLATAKEFIEQGATVVAADFSEKNLQEASKKLGGRYVPRLCDVTSEQQLIDICQFVNDKYGKLDVLVNNAGVGKFGGIEDITEKDFYKLYDLLLKGPVLLVKHAVPLLRKSSNPSIVNVSSWASRTYNWDTFLYSTAKTAIEKFTYHLVGNLPGIRCNVIIPGYIDTAIVENSGLDRNQVNAAFEFLSKNSIPMGRIGRPEDLANGILFLCSEKSSYINGTSLVIDGGFLCCFGGIKPKEGDATLSYINTDK